MLNFTLLSGFSLVITAFEHSSERIIINWNLVFHRLILIESFIIEVGYVIFNPTGNVINQRVTRLRCIRFSVVSSRKYASVF